MLNRDMKMVVKIGSSTLSFSNGKMNFQRLKMLVRIIAEVKMRGIPVVLVSSGAVAVGGGLVRMKKKPHKLEVKQALAAIGQAELMKIYRKFFHFHQLEIAQVLLTRDGLNDPVKRENARNTLLKLLDMDIIPVINENDTISTYGIRIGNNDILAASVATIIQADKLVILSDIDGLYTEDPAINPQATLIPVVTEITSGLRKNATNSRNNFGTGGMGVKLEAARICMDRNIDMIIANGKNPSVILDIVEGKNCGTLFTTRNNTV